MAGYHYFKITFGFGFWEIQECNRGNPKRTSSFGFCFKWFFFPSQNPSTIDSFHEITGKEPAAISLVLRSSQMWKLHSYIRIGS